MVKLIDCSFCSWNHGVAVSQNHRLHILLQAQVVCATLSGSGSRSIIEAVILSEKRRKRGGKTLSKKQKKKRAREKRADDGNMSDRGNGVLKFDAVVMDEAAQAVEPSSLIPLKFNPRYYFFGGVVP